MGNELRNDLSRESGITIHKMQVIIGIYQDNELLIKTTNKGSN